MIATPHALARIRERYGIEATRDDLIEVTLQITDRPPRALLLASAERDGRWKERWLVTIQGRPVHILYLPRTTPYPTIVTALALWHDDLHRLGSPHGERAERKRVVRAPRRERQRVAAEMRGETE